MQIPLTVKQVRTLSELAENARANFDTGEQPEITLITNKDKSTITLKIQRPIDWRDEYMTPSGQYRYPKKAFRTYIIDEYGKSTKISD